MTSSLEMEQPFLKGKDKGEAREKESKLQKAKRSKR